MTSSPFDLRIEVAGSAADWLVVWDMLFLQSLDPWHDPAFRRSAIERMDVIQEAIVGAGLLPPADFEFRRAYLLGGRGGRLAPGLGALN